MPDQPADHFSPIAQAYARGRIGYPAALFDFLTGLCPARDLAWDCATGSGQAVGELAPRFQRVVATDISPDLLGHAPSLPNVTYSVTRAEQAPLDPKSVDLVTVAQALHWFSLPAFWAELDRVLKPAGIFAFWGYTWPRVNDAVDAELGPLRRQLGPYWPTEAAILQNEYRDIVAPFTPVPAPTFEAATTWTRHDYMAHLGSWSAVRYYRERTGTDPLPDFDRRLERLWPTGEKNLVRWPLALRVARK